MAEKKNKPRHLQNVNAMGKIILIEDDSFLANMYRAKLEMEGFEVKIAYDGKSGLDLVRKEPPHLILLDIILPKLDGWQVLEALKKDKELKNIPVILLTNLGQKEDVEKGLALGADDYLIKAHFVPREVITKIKAVLKKK